MNRQEQHADAPRPIAEDKAFAVPVLTGREVLVVGLGGGSDIVSSYIVSLLLRRGNPKSIVYANTKRSVEAGSERVSDHVYRVQPAQVGPGDLWDSEGTLAIDRTVPRGDRDCPWVVWLPRGHSASLLGEEIGALGFDLLVGVDTGGDSLVEETLSGHEGRDKQMLRVLRAARLPVIHVVVAPGCDGEFSQEQLARAFEREASRDAYLGQFLLDEFSPVLRDLGRGLRPDRTVRIVLAALDRSLLAEPDGQVRIPRCCRPVVPRKWLTTAWVFQA